MGEFALDAASLQCIHDEMKNHEWVEHIRMRAVVKGSHTYWIQSAYRECVCGKVEDTHGR